MATHKKEVSITDLQQKILSNDLYNDTDNASNQADFVALVTARSDYKNRKTRDDENAL